MEYQEVLLCLSALTEYSTAIEEYIFSEEMNGILAMELSRFTPIMNLDWSGIKPKQKQKKR